MKGIEYKFNIKGVAMSFWKGSGDKTIIFASGFPQYVTSYHPFVSTLVSLGYNLLVPKYKGTWESDGVFGIKTSIESIQAALELVRLGKVVELFGNNEIQIPNKEVIVVGFSYGALITLLTEASNIKKILLMPFLNLELHGKEELQKEISFIIQAYPRVYAFDPAVLISELENIRYPEVVSDQNITLVTGTKDVGASKDEIDWFIKKYLVSPVVIDAGHTANLSMDQFSQFLSR